MEKSTGRARNAVSAQGRKRQSGKTAGGAKPGSQKDAKEAQAFYVYCIGKSAAITPLLENKQPDMPEAIESKSPLEMIADDDLAAIVSAVPLADYNEEALQAHLSDPQWTAVRAVRHEKVVEHFAARATVIPLRFGTIYLEAAGVEAMLLQRQDELHAVLSRLHGREEWSLNIYRDSARLMQSLESLSPRLREATERAAGASPGQAYLLRKKIDAVRADEARVETQRVINEIESCLSAISDGAARLRLLKDETAPHGEPVARLAFLVERAGFDKFRAVAEQLAQQYTPCGFRLELMGPWPAYNFAVQ